MKRPWKRGTKGLVRSIMSRPITIKPKDKPKWYEFRKKFSNYLVSIARKIYPDNPEVNAFYAELMMDWMVSGKSVVRVDPNNIVKEHFNG